MKVLNLPVAAEPTLRATCVSDKNGTHEFILQAHGFCTEYSL